MRKLTFLLIVFFAGALNGISQNISFKGISEKAVVVNQQFRVNYILTTNGERGKDIHMPEVNGLVSLFGATLSGQNSSTNIINGSISTQLTLTYTYVLMAKQEGTYTIPPATIKVGNSEYKSNEITIKVLPPDQAEAATSTNQSNRNQEAASQPANPTSIENSDLFIRMQVSKPSVYENEGFLVTFKLYSLVNVTNFDNVKFPEFEGFIAQEIELPANNQINLENYNGRNYSTIVLKQTILYPQRPGKITIGSGKFDANVKVRASRQRPRSFFDDFFDTYQNVKKTLTSSPVTIDVKALPSNKPASFSGAVGDYKMTSSISATKLKANDAVTIKLTISGNGNIKLVKNPEIVFPADFDIFDPKVDVNTRVSASGVTGSKTIEYYAIPRYPGNFTIPKVQFSYFDLKTKTYKSLSTEEFHLQVEPGKDVSNTPAVINSSNKEDIRYLGQDIRHIKMESFSFLKKEFLFGSFIYWLIYLIPSALFIIFFIYFRKQVKQNANIALMRTKKANKVAAQRLKKADNYLKENQKETFYDEILKAVWGYLSDKLSIPVSSLTKDNVEMELTKYGAEDILISQFMEILNTAEFARFAPSQGQGAMDELYHSTVNAINKMENTIKK
jgi:hypothetical protein